MFHRFQIDGINIIFVGSRIQWVEYYPSIKQLRFQPNSGNLKTFNYKIKSLYNLPNLIAHKRKKLKTKKPYKSKCSSQF